MSKNTGCKEIDPPDPKVHWRDWYKCPCGHRHILELPYLCIPDPDEVMSYECNGILQETDAGLSDLWRTMVTELEKPLIVSANIKKIRS